VGWRGPKDCKKEDRELSYAVEDGGDLDNSEAVVVEFQDREHMELKKTMGELTSSFGGCQKPAQELWEAEHPVTRRRICLGQRVARQ